MAWALASALWLGILTSISPCPLATNIAAISFLGRRVAEPAGALWSGLAYTAGRAATFMALGANRAARAFNRVSRAEVRLRRLTGSIFIAVGIYYALLYVFEVRYG